MPDGLPTINKDSLVHLSTPFLPQFPFVLICLWGPSSSWGISMSLQSGESHRSRVILPDCQISNFHFFFFRLGNCSWYHSFLKTTYFSDCTCNQLGHPHYLSTSFHFLFWLLSKVLSQNFQFFFPEISILHFLAIIFGYSTFWLTLHVPPSTNIVIGLVGFKVLRKNNYRRQLRRWHSDTGKYTQPSRNTTA